MLLQCNHEMVHGLVVNRLRILIGAGQSLRLEVQMRLSGKALGIEFVSYTGTRGLLKHVFDQAAPKTCLIMQQTKKG